MTKPPAGDALVRRHLRFGCWSLLVFLVLGSVLEALHGFKVQWYVSLATETRRHLWTLAHAHGTLVALVNIALALTWKAANPPRSSVLASRSLLAAGVLLPGGFFLGGTVIHAGDPGVGIVLVPVGAALLFLAVFLTARGIRS